jgi:uncharacterized protein YkwD
MPWALISLLVLVLGAGATPEKATVNPSDSKDASAAAAEHAPSPATPSPLSPSPYHDAEAEGQLLALANQDRARAGVPPLHIDAGLSLAARAHAGVMAQWRQASHQFSGEPSLTRRIATASQLYVDLAGENVALDSSPADAHRRLMHSPPHRENLLDPAFNAAGFGVIRAGGRLYIVEDFARSLPVYSASQTEDVIAGALHRLRQRAGLPDLARVDQPALREAACSMALEDRLATQQMRELAQHYTVINYTNLHPEILPASTNRIVTDRHITSAAIGACYARSATYPTGAYWVGLVVY